MVNVRIVRRAGFEIVGKKTWIGGQENEAFGAFWQASMKEGLLERFRQINGLRVGAQTGGNTLGVSCVDADPANRAFDYWIAIELPEQDAPASLGALDGLERRAVPAGEWAVFACRGPLPQAIVDAEMYAFGEWLPSSGYRHAHAPEMEVYLPSDETPCEFWLPIEKA